MVLTITLINNNFNSIYTLSIVSKQMQVIICNKLIISDKKTKKDIYKFIRTILSFIII